jgi:hypothetical protein
MTPEQARDRAQWIYTNHQQGNFIDILAQELSLAYDAGAAWQREQDARIAESEIDECRTPNDQNCSHCIASGNIARVIRAQGSKQDNPPTRKP